LVDVLTLAALGLSTVTLFAVLYVLVAIKRRSVGTGPDSGNLESTLGEVKGSVSGLQAAVTQLVSTVGEIRRDTGQTTSGMEEMKKFATLLTGSSQKRGAAGEIIVRSYLERLPKELWEEQYYLPGSSDRVDYALRMNNSGSQLYLPIDAKFSLPDGVENFEGEANRLARKRAEELVKYIAPGVTTDFAVMVLPNSVFYALTAETVGSMQEIKVVACPPEGIIILSSLALRAHQAIVLAKSAERLTTYVLEIDGKLEHVGADFGRLAKNLKSAYKNADQAAEDIDDTRKELGSITTHLGEVTGAQPAPALQASPAALFGDTAEDQSEET
jgi:DNA recombination protein RmuC